MMGITSSLLGNLFTGSLTQTTTSMYKSEFYTTLNPNFSTATFEKINLLINDIYTLYTDTTTKTNYLNKKET